MAYIVMANMVMGYIATGDLSSAKRNHRKVPPRRAFPIPALVRRVRPSRHVRPSIALPLLLGPRPVRATDPGGGSAPRSTRRGRGSRSLTAY